MPAKLCAGVPLGCGTAAATLVQASSAAVHFIERAIILCRCISSGRMIRETVVFHLVTGIVRRMLSDYMYIYLSVVRLHLHSILE